MFSRLILREPSENEIHEKLATFKTRHAHIDLKEYLVFFSNTQKESITLVLEVFQ